MKKFKKILVQFNIIEPEEQNIIFEFAAKQIKDWTNCLVLDDSNYTIELFKRAIIKFKNLEKSY